MSYKINRSDSASPLLPNSAAPEARGPTKPKHPNIFGRSLFSKAPKNSSTSMAPRDNTPLLSAEQHAVHSDGSVAGARPGSMRSASSLLGRAGKAMSSGARVVSSGMQQAGKVMSNAYQAHNEPRYTRLPTDHSQEYQARPHTPPTARTEVRADAHMTENVRPLVNGQENGQGGRPQGVGPAPGRTTPLQPSSQPLATSRPAMYNAPSSGRNPPSAPAKTTERAPLGVHTGNVPQPTVRPRPAAGGAENADPNVGRRSQPAVVKANLPAFTKLFEGGRMDRPLEPKQLVKAMVDVSKGAPVEQRVHQEIARNPQWGRQMEQRWNTLRNSVADARDGGNAQVPSLENMLAKHPLALLDFIASGSQQSFDKLMRPQRQATPPQTPAAPGVAAHAQPTRPQGRDDMRPQSPRTEHAVQPPRGNESRPTDKLGQLTATLKDLEQQVAASEKKGEAIDHRLFRASGAESAAAMRESYAHKAEHGALIAARDQVQSARNDMLAGPVLARLKDVDGKIADLEQRAGELNKVIARWPSGSQQRVAATKEKNSLRPAWQALTAERADMRTQLEGLRPEFQQARQLAQGLTELAGAKGAKEGPLAIGGRYPLHYRETIETNYERLDQSKHLLGKEPQLQAAQQQLRALFQSGKLEGLSPKEAGELGKLAGLDLGAQFEKLSHLQDVVATTRKNLRAMGAGGLYEGIRATAGHDMNDELRSHQDALDNGYL